MWNIRNIVRFSHIHHESNFREVCSNVQVANRKDWLNDE